MRIAAPLAAAALLALADGMRAAAAQETRTDTAASARWNVAARRLLLGGPGVAPVSQQGATNGRPAPAGRPPIGGIPRVMAAVSAAQYEAVERAVSAGASAHVAAAAASAAVLGSFLARDSALVAAELARDVAAARRAGESEARIAAGRRAGAGAAAALLAWIRTDGAGAAWTGTVPEGPGLWRSAPNVPPGGATIASMRPWTLASADQFRPGPPPKFDSPEFRAALDEVRRYAQARTPEQIRIAQHWARVNPPDEWNRIAVDVIVRHRLPPEKAARLLALVGIAAMDAQIACWEAKYHYWLLRPSQADSTIALPPQVGLPNFPAYPSGHACGAGAVAAVVAHLVPESRVAMEAVAEEAAMSRLYAGVHFRFDNDDGLALGRTVARWVIEQDAQGALRRRWR
ncbi:MAG TPA: vanadium-dependent haloperoxidase [Gemmatimonadaceae bacterium]|nr:vanadium-dependent haloperoxidase [Gemmatimonadaceae bacterium]